MLNITKIMQNNDFVFYVRVDGQKNDMLYSFAGLIMDELGLEPIDCDCDDDFNLVQYDFFIESFNDDLAVKFEEIAKGFEL